MRPDLIVTHIKHVDYPIFRRTLNDYGSFFGKVLIYFSEHNRFPYFDHFIHESLRNTKDVEFVDPIHTEWGVEDWRDVSTKETLRRSDSDWVCSVEQDFFSRKWDKLLVRTEEAMGKYEFFGLRAWQGSPPRDYVHPSFWFIKRELLDRTSRNFAAAPEYGADHFGLITDDVNKLGVKPVYLDECGFKTEVAEDADCFHLGGVNGNYLEGLKSEYVYHRPEIFAVYNRMCREVEPASPKFIELSLKIEDELKRRGYNPNDKKWEIFFK